jgi:hypothetical protein
MSNKPYKKNPLSIFLKPTMQPREGESVLSSSSFLPFTIEGLEK